MNETKLHYFLTRIPEHPALVFGILAFLTFLLQRHFSTFYISKILASVSIICVATSLIIATVFAISPIYWDHVEAHIASVSANVAKGLPAYHNPESPERYSISYGPIIYITLSKIYALFGPNLLFIKFIPLILITMSFGAFYLTLKRENSPQDCNSSLYALGILGGGLLLFFPAGFWLRPDSFVLLFVSIGLLTATSKRLFPNTLFGACIGLLLCTKIYSPIYLFPAYISLIRNRPVLKTLLISLAASLTIFLIFSHPQISLSNHLHWILGATNHGVSKNLLRFNAEYLIVILLICGSWKILYFSKSSKTESLWPFFLPVFLAIYLFSSKLGAGWYYFLPLVPVLLLYPFFPTSLHKLFSEKTLLTIMTSGLISLLIAGVSKADDINQWLNLIPKATKIKQEIISYAKSNPSEVISLGSSGFEKGWADRMVVDTRPELALNGHPVFIDPSAMIDMSISFSSKETDDRAFKDLPITVWIFSRESDPFSAFPYSEHFRNLFLKKFYKADETENLSIWKSQNLNPPIN